MQAMTTQTAATTSSRPRHVAVDVAGQRCGHPEYRKRDPEAQNEHQRQPEGAQHARLAVAAASHEAHHQRNHGQHARVRCREHAATNTAKTASHGLPWRYWPTFLVSSANTTSLRRRRGQPRDYLSGLRDAA